MTEQEKNIERYLQGEMTAAEKQQFEKEIAKDAQLKAQISLNKEMNSNYDESDWALLDKNVSNKKTDFYQEALNSSEGKKLISNIKDAEVDYFSETSSRRIPFKWISIAAGVALLILAYFLIPSLITKSNQELYATYSDWSNLPSLTLRSAENNLSQGEQLFNDHRYEEAIVIFENYIVQNSETINPQVLFYQGICYLELNQPEKAITIFNDIQNSNSLDVQKANWYLVLAYLKAEDREKAKSLLNQILKYSFHYNYLQADKLREALE